MPAKTLDEYLKQTTHKTTKQPATKPKYRITGFYKETQFQETPIGKIPKQWQVAKLKEIFEFQRGFSYRKKDISEVPTSIRFITINDIEKEGGRKKDAKPIYLKEELKIDNRFLLMKGDLLIANTDMSKGFIIGAPLYIDDAFVEQGKILVYSMDLTKLMPRISVNTKFFFYLLSWNSIRKIMKSFAQGTNVLHINHDLVRNLNMAIPPLEEQWGIAEVLSALDRAIEATERLIGRLERLKRGLMQELLTKGIGHREFQETPIGKIPKQWHVVKLGTLFTFKNGKRPSVVREHGQIPIYGAGFIQGYTDDFMVDEDNVIIIARVGKGSAGKVYIASGKMWISDNAIYATPKNNLAYPVFYYYLLQFLRLDKIAVRSAAGGYSLITQSSLNNLYVPLPPYEEQKYIASTLSSIDEWIKLEKKRKEKIERLKHGLMELLLTGRVRIRVVTTSSSSSSFSGG